MSDELDLLLKQTYLLGKLHSAFYSKNKSLVEKIIKELEGEGVEK